MSIKATIWAWSIDLPETPKMVLLALAHKHHDKTGVCCPSAETIAKMCGLSVRAVRTHISNLSRDGVIKIVSRSVNGKTQSNQYALFGKLGVKDAHPLGVQKLAGLGVKDVHPSRGEGRAPNKEDNILRGKSPRQEEGFGGGVIDFSEWRAKR